ncbi:uncharacterized protein KGF55_001003 [Candida pseudojiufengensis]|uniref:uncharacterized protein n=1 Tax=Candida pseudojiufengensis TaxID=497109 RepID=UPI0022242A15|nr:uncharacterized protein KGF55_001003 [Candida pseudojiufengensis]KAI5965641.1 hypothetical protein KGF55_001003 [Candida pseudojiufengensis]
MPIKSLEPFLFERKLVYPSSIEILTNATIGIDVENYLNRIYTSKKEHFLAAIGGSPSSLKDYIYADLQVFKEFSIKPIFVISRSNTQSQNIEYKSNELSPVEQSLESTWNKISNLQKQNSNYHQHFQAFENYRSLNESIPLQAIINDLVSIFIEFGVDYLITPYDSSFQLSYLYQSKIVDTIYGSTDLLLTQIDKFILGIENQTREFRFVDKHKILQELRINERQLQDLSLIVGCSLQPNTFPIFPKPLPNYPPINIFKFGLDSLYQYAQVSGNHQDLYGYVLNLNDQKLVDWYLKGQSLIKFTPIITKEGYVELYNVELAKLGLDKNVDFLGDDDEIQTDGSGNNTPTKPLVKVPNNLHEIISQRLPPELYYYQSLGLIPAEILSSIAGGRLDVRPPAELGKSDSYKKLVSSKFYTDLLDKQYNLITQLLARYYQVKKINVKFWFNDSVLALNNRMNPPITKEVENVFTKSSQTSFSIKYGLLSNLNTDSKSDQGPDAVETQVDLISSAFSRALHVYGIIDDKNQVSTIGKIFKELINEHEDISDEDLEHLILLSLLLKSDTFKLTNANPDYFSVGKPYKDLLNEANYELSASENKSILLISRIFGMKKFNIAPVNYQGPISRNLLSFRSSISFINTQLLHTIEVLLVDMIVRQEKNNVKIDYNKNDWYELISQIPFYQEVNNTLLGIVSEIYLEITLKKLKSSGNKSESITFAKHHLADNVFQVNSTSYNATVSGENAITSDQISKDFDNGKKWWNKFVNFIRKANIIDNKLCSNALVQEVEDADKLFNDLTE